MSQISGLSTMSEAMAGVTNYYDWLFSMLSPFLGGSVVEVGPGYGNFCDFILQSNKSYLGVDSDSFVIDRLKEKFHDRPGRFMCGDITTPELATVCRERKVDTVLSMNVLEHIEDDENHLHQTARCCPGGFFLLFVPALPFLYGTMDREAGHFRRYTRQSLSSLVSKAGLRVNKMFYFNFVGGLAWFLSARVLKSHLNSGGTNRSILLYDKYVVPVARKIDGVLRSFGGQSLMAVLDIPKEAQRW